MSARGIIASCNSSITTTMKYGPKIVPWIAHPADKNDTHQPQRPEPGKMFGADRREIADPERPGNSADKAGDKRKKLAI